MNKNNKHSKYSMEAPKKEKPVNYDLPLGKNIRFKEGCRRKVISVYASQSDTTHPKVLELAKGAGYLTEERYNVLVNTEKGVKPELNPEELGNVLENFFGFVDGMAEIHECHGIQRTRFGKQLAGELRYTGEERTDKEWLESPLCSIEVRELSKYGGEVSMYENQGHGEMVINDYLDGR